jgi:NADH-quinone oxidoreductase subunit M
MYAQYLLGDMTGYQFIETYNWLPALGISLKFGVDGMSAPLVLLTGIVMFTGVLISWGDDDKHVMSGIQDRPREFFAFLFLLAGGVFGVFVSLDLFMLFFFYEIAVFPMYLLIAIWGWVKTREYAAMKLTLYLFIGSVVALVGALAMYWTQYQNTGVLSFDMLLMESAGFSVAFQYAWFLPVFFGFAVLGGIWPFHNWSPDGHVAAPTAVSMFHAGVLMKLGAFAALRVGVMLLPEGAKQWAWLHDDLRRRCGCVRRLHRFRSDRYEIYDRFLLCFSHGSWLCWVFPHSITTAWSARECRCSRTVS